MKIIFVTHGQTLENAEGILIGQLMDRGLSPLGKSQAQVLGQKLKDTKIDTAYSSDLSRAIQTANEILRYHKDLQLNLTKDLRERNYGASQGKKKSEIGWHDEMVFEDHSDFEPIKDLCARIEEFLLKIEKRHRNDTVLLVAHRNWGVALECVVNRVPPSKFNTIILMKSGEMKTFDYNGKEVRIKL